MTTRMQISFEIKNEDKYKQVQEEAEKQGLSKASYCRAIILQKLNEVQNAGATNTT